VSDAVAAFITPEAAQENDSDGLNGDNDTTELERLHRAIADGANVHAWNAPFDQAVWNAVQRNWQGERWIRVTDDQQLAQFIQVNGVGIDPQTGQPRPQQRWRSHSQ
jgi:hypothetical protein